MPELVWPAILVALLAGLVASSIPFLTTFDPHSPAGEFALLVGELSALRDFQARLTVSWGDSKPSLELKVAWLAGEGALRAEIVAPADLAGQVFTYQGGQINHFLPAKDGVPAGVIIVPATGLLPQLGGQGAEQAAFKPQDFITAIRLGTLRITEEHTDSTKTLTVTGQFPGLPSLKQLTLVFAVQGEGTVSLGDLSQLRITLWGSPSRTITISFSGVKLNQGLTLHEIRSFPQPYKWILPRQED